jgi:hypothetical protein
MKVRFDFVTNSSSTSYIVWPNVCFGDLDELKEFLKGDYYLSYFHDYPDAINDCIFSTFPDDNEMQAIAREYIEAAVVLRKLAGELEEFIPEEYETDDDDDYYDWDYEEDN